MKKIALLLLVLIIFTSLSFSDDKPLIRINSNVTDDNWSWISEGDGFFLFRKILEANGYRVDQKFYLEITEESLKGVDIFIFSEAALTLTDSDKKALRKFIRDGGAVLIMGYDDEYADLKNLESFTKDYGITFGNIEIDGYPIQVKNDLGIFSDTTKRVFYYGWNLFIDESNAIPLLVEENLGTIGFAISTSRNLGSSYGKLAVSGTDAIFFSDYPYGGGGLDVVPAELERADNVAFMLEIMAYLISKPELGVNWVNYKGKGFIPGETLSVKTKLVNKGEMASGKAKVTVVFTDEADFSKLVEADYKVIKKVATEIPVGEKKTFEIAVKVPAGYSLSEAYIHVYVEDGINPVKGLKRLKTKMVPMK